MRKQESKRVSPHFDVIVSLRPEVLHKFWHIPSHWPTPVKPVWLKSLAVRKQVFVLSMVQKVRLA